MKYYVAVLLAFMVTMAFAFVAGNNCGNVNLSTPKLKRMETQDFHMLYDDGRACARWAFPKRRMNFSGDDETIKQRIRAFCAANERYFGNSTTLGEISVLRRANKTFVNVSQEFCGRQVLDGGMYFRVASNGYLWACGSKFFANFENATSFDAREYDAAIFAAQLFLREELGVSSPVFLGNVRELFFPDGDTARAAYEIQMSGNYPDRYNLWLSSKDLRILGWENEIRYYDVNGDVGIFHQPAFFDDEQDSAAFAHGRISFSQVQDTLTDAHGHYYYNVLSDGGFQPFKSWLCGLYCQVWRMDGPSAYLWAYFSVPSDWSFCWRDGNSIVDERNLYYHTTYYHDYMKSLDTDFDVMDYAVPSRCRVPDQPENAYWDGYGANFGGGGERLRNLAQFSNVIYHEYTHGISDKMYRDVFFPYSAESGALNEAFSDFFACSRNNTRYAGERLMTDDSFLRDLINTKTMPRDWVNEPHGDGEIVAAAFWNIRSLVAPTYATAESIVHFARYSGANTFYDFAIECFFVADDDDSIENGCRLLSPIANSFAAHGIGPGRFPTLLGNFAAVADADGDGFISAGEDFVIETNVKYINEFPYPRAEGLLAYVELVDELGILACDTVVVGTLARNDSLGLTFSLTLPYELLPHYAHAVFYCGTAGDFAAIDTIEIPVGYPQLLLAMEHGNDHILRFFANALRAHNVVYDIDTVDGSFSNVDNLSNYDVVLHFSGDSMSSLNSFAQERILSYFNAGGNVLFTGQDVADNTSAALFLDELFGAQVASLSTGARMVSGVDGTELGDDASFTLIGAPGAANQRTPSVLTPSAGEGFAFYAGTAEAFAGVSKRAAGRAVLFSCGIEAIGSGTGGRKTLVQLMRSLLDYFAVETYSAIDAQTIVPQKFIVRAYPNPFNAAVTIETADTGDKHLIIYDLRGQIVDENRFSSRSFTWNAQNIPSGVYFYRLKTPKSSTCGKLLLTR